MKTALLFGSSGLIGSNLLDNLINNNNYNKIKIFVRGLPSINNSKVEVIKTDFLDLETLKENLIGDDCFFCIGTTHKDTPDKNEYRRIEYDLPVHLAKIAKFNSINNFIYVSSIGANPKASSTYLKRQCVQPTLPKHPVRDLRDGRSSCARSPLTRITFQVSKTSSATFFLATAAVLQHGGGRNSTA